MTRETQSAIHCPLCGQKAVPEFADYSWELREDGRSFHYARCPSCDTMFADPLPNAEEVSWLYRVRYDYSWFAQRQRLKRWQAIHRWRRLEGIFRELKISNTPRRLLDVGSGHGWFLRAAKDAGWQVEGLDMLDDQLVAAAARDGIILHQGSLVDHSLPAGEFDVVTAWHVVEHIPEIRSAVDALERLLTDGGIAVIVVPNYHAAGLARSGLRWVWCQKPFIHPWHLSATTLKKVLPPSLEILLLTSRDTWDAQWAESTWPYRFGMLVFSLATRIPRKLAAVCRWQWGVTACDQIRFLAEEALRLTTYAAYLALRPLTRRIYEDALAGSELMLVARKKAVQNATISAK
jgi:SAM-dependent methyltransferase